MESSWHIVSLCWVSGLKFKDCRFSNWSIIFLKIYKYFHESTTFLIEHKKSWVVYKHLKKLTKRCSCWWYKRKKLQNVTLEMRKPTKLSKFHMWNFFEIRSGYMWVGKFGWFKWVSKRLRSHCCDNCDIVFVKVELLWKIVGANMGCAQVH